MKHSATYRYPLRLARTDKRKVDAVARETGTTINQVLVISVRKGLPLARKALCKDTDRITNVEPLPDKVWRRIYMGEDELDSLSNGERRWRKAR